MSLRLVLFLALSFIMNIQVSAGAIHSECDRLLKEGVPGHASGQLTDDPSDLSASELSYLRLIEMSLKNKFISFQDLDLVIKKLQNGQFINPLENKSLASESLAYKHAFDKLSLAVHGQSLKLIEGVDELLFKEKVTEESRREVREETRLIYFPQEIEKINMLESVTASPVHFVDLSGRDMVAAVSASGQLSVFDMADPGKVVTSKSKDKAGQLSPMYILTQDKREFIVLASSFGNLYLFNLKDLSNPIIFNTGVSYHENPTHFVNQDGVDMLAAASGNSTLYLIDLIHTRISKSINVHGALFSSPIHIVDKNGRDTIVAGTANGEINFLDLKDSKNPKILNLQNSNVVSTSHFVDISGRDKIVIACAGSIHVVDLLNIKDHTIFEIEGKLKLKPTHFVDVDGRDRLAVGESSGKLYLIDIKSDRPIEKILVPAGIQSRPQHYASKSGHDWIGISSALGHYKLINLQNRELSENIKTGWVAADPIIINSASGLNLMVVGSKDKNLHIIDLENPQSPVKVPDLGEIDSSPIHFVTQDEREVVVVGSHSGHVHTIELFNKSAQREVVK